jgi:hypothetical protein
MGGDYYIEIFLKIVHNDGTCYIELPRVRGDFSSCVWGIYDEHEDDIPYWKSDEAVSLQKQAIAFMLKPRPDVVIYSNKQYKSEYLRKNMNHLFWQK